MPKIFNKDINLTTQTHLRTNEETHDTSFDLNWTHLVRFEHPQLTLTQVIQVSQGIILPHSLKVGPCGGHLMQLTLFINNIERTPSIGPSLRWPRLGTSFHTPLKGALLPCK